METKKRGNQWNRWERERESINPKGAPLKISKTGKFLEQ